MKKIIVCYNGRGESGNIFWILRAVCEELTRHGVSPAVLRELQQRVFASGSYYAALDVLREKVTLIDTSDGRSLMRDRCWIVYYDANNHKELLRTTVEGSFEDETRSTIELLAFERSLDPNQIKYYFTTD